MPLEDEVPELLAVGLEVAEQVPRSPRQERALVVGEADQLEERQVRNLVRIEGRPELPTPFAVAAVRPSSEPMRLGLLGDLEAADRQTMVTLLHLVRTGERVREGAVRPAFDVD